MKLLISPHNDDESLFAAYTLIRERPLVIIVTDSFVQWNRGDSITAQQRWDETVRAMEYLSCPTVRLGIKDTELTKERLKEELKRFCGFDKVYAPAKQGGHPHHDLCAEVVMELFQDRASYYTTYTKTDLYTTGDIEIKPTQEEIELKNKALSCYESQIRINKPHFDAVINKSEWLKNSL